MITAPDYGDLTLRPPELTFPDRMTLHLDEFPVELRHVGRPAHTTNDVLVWLPEQRVLFAGDLAFNGGQPFVLEGSIAGFRGAIAQMQALAPEVLAPGHGPVCRGEEVRPAADGDGRLPRVRRARRRRVVRRRPDPARGGAEAPRQPLLRLGRDRAVRRQPAPRVLRASPATRLDTRLTVPSVWPDMVAFHGGPIACHA